MCEPCHEHHQHTPARSYQENKAPPVSPYRDGKKDKNFVNPSLISNGVFYNMEYPQPDKNLQRSVKRQTITEKITNLNRSKTPEPNKAAYQQYETEQKSTLTTPINHHYKNQENPLYKSQKCFHEEEYKPIEKPHLPPNYVEKPPLEATTKKPSLMIDVQDTIQKETENCEKMSEKSCSMTSFTRNKDNLICNYCINQDLIDQKRAERELEDRRNKQIQQLNDNFYHSILHDNYLRQIERQKLLKETRDSQRQIIENKKNHYMSQKNLSINYEKEVNQLKEEENRMAKEQQLQSEREKKETLKRELENQINEKNREKNEYLSQRYSSKDISLNINNQYCNPYLPKKSDYFNEIERQKQYKQEATLREKEVKIGLKILYSFLGAKKKLFNGDRTAKKNRK